MERQKLAKEMETLRPKVLKRKLLSNKAADPKGRADLEAGNFNGAPTASTLKQINYQHQCEERLDDDHWTDLDMHADKLEEMYGKNSVFVRCKDAFKFGWSTDRMLLHLQKESHTSKPLVVHLDSTGKFDSQNLFLNTCFLLSLNLLMFSCCCR